MESPLTIPLEYGLTLDPTAKLRTVQFRVDGLDKVNRDGIPSNRFGSSFQEIHDIDYICEQAGGEEIVKERKLLGCYDAAMTAYRVGNVLVINRTFGHHADRTTSVISVEGQTPDTNVVEQFKKFYCKDPLTVDPPRVCLILEPI